MEIKNKKRREEVLKGTLTKAKEIAAKLWADDPSTIYLDARACHGAPKYIFDGCRFIEIQSFDLSCPCRVIGQELISFQRTQYNVYDLRGDTK
jgi:hypothetical protein